jgi:hypothetical protein
MLGIISDLENGLRSWWPSSICTCKEVMVVEVGVEEVKVNEVEEVE